MNRFTPRFFMTWVIELNTKNSTRWGHKPPPGWVFGVQLGLRQTQALFKTKKNNERSRRPEGSEAQSALSLQYWRRLQYWRLRALCASLPSGLLLLSLFFLVLNSACVCRRPSWTPKTQPGGGLCPHLVEFLVFNSITHVIKKRGVNRFMPHWFICML